ncbi:embryo-specific protein ATS3B-like [Malania oleifera]|uniref:embryo-specific protein ATS3B-like n=1 Tax=Malania oleifera TaxID=397392 RepID=UPI0025AE3B7A|nr:embryo-specific protein ATS3B-like [Malania oleifera]
MKAACYLLQLAFIFIAFSQSRARSIIPRPHPLGSFEINTTHSQNAATCSFTVTIKTSCSSPSYTRDQISISFGDAYGNQVYAPRIDDPSTRTFERCSSDTFYLYGPCTYQICYLYLYRSGRDGWKPETVTVYAYNSSPATFYYNTFIPRDVWFGFNLCSASSSSKSAM